MFQLVVCLELWCDVLPGLVVTGVVTGVVVGAGVVVTGVVVSDDDELDPAPLDAALMPVLAADDESLVVAVVVAVVAVVDVALAAVVDVELVDDVLVTLAASNGSRVRLVGVARCPADPSERWAADDGVVDVPLGAGGVAISALAGWPCSRNGTATMAAMMITASGQRRRSKRSRLRDFIL